MSRWAGIALAALLLLPGTALGHGAGAHGVTAVRAAAITQDGRCSGASLEDPRVIEGSFSSEQQGSYVLVPFDVPEGTTAVRVKYCFDANDGPLAPLAKHTIDMGIYDARPAAGALWGEEEFRGWGGSSHPDVIISGEGFKSEAEYDADERSQVPGKTTRGYRPGPIEPGEWAVELGVAAVVPRSQGDADGRVKWLVEIELRDDAEFADEPYEPAPYDETPARPGPGWYAGDMHVHAEHSSLGDATMRETFDYAFGPAGLDFITLSDYVTSSAWDEIGRHQSRYPGRLVARSAEIITYRGHTNNHGSATYVDYRTGPVYERMADGRLELKRPAQPASRLFDDVHAAGGYTQINHPTIFPSAVPLFPFLCRGCPWDYSDEETDYGKVDAIEIATGPAGLKDPLKVGPNPFTVTALAFYQDALSTGAKIAAVGVSDSHRAGRVPSLQDDPQGNITQAPVGQATTVVYADELSEEGIQRGVEAGHTYVKLYGNDGPDLRFEAWPAGGGERAMMGDTVRTAGAVHFKAQVLGAAPLSGRDPKKPDPYELLVTWNGLPLFVLPVLEDELTFPFTLALPGRWQLQLQRGTTIEAVSSPIYVEAP